MELVFALGVLLRLVPSFFMSFGHFRTPMSTPPTVDLTPANVNDRLDDISSDMDLDPISVIDVEDDVQPPQAPAAPSKKKQDTLVYHWCFTFNNPPSDVALWFYEVTEGDEAWPVNYMVCQVEKGHGKKSADNPTAGTRHIQGYVEFTDRKRLTTVKKLPLGGGSIHWEHRKGTPTQARAYCMKPSGNYQSSTVYATYVFAMPRVDRLITQYGGLCQDCVNSLGNDRSFSDDYWDLSPVSRRLHFDVDDDE